VQAGLECREERGHVGVTEVTEVTEVTGMVRQGAMDRKTTDGECGAALGRMRHGRGARQGQGMMR
jgi:hypothetical protein